MSVRDDTVWYYYAKNTSQTSITQHATAAAGYFFTATRLNVIKETPGEELIEASRHLSLLLETVTEL